MNTQPTLLVLAAGKIHSLTGDELVSMNLWGFTPDIFQLLRGQFDEFLKRQGHDEKSE